MGAISEINNLHCFSSNEKKINARFMPATKKKNKLNTAVKVTINPELNNKYVHQPVFKDKIDKANYILKTVGLPKA